MSCPALRSPLGTLLQLQNAPPPLQGRGKRRQLPPPPTSEPRSRLCNCVFLRLPAADPDRVRDKLHVDGPSTGSIPRGRGKPPGAEAANRRSPSAGWGTCRRRKTSARRLHSSRAEPFAMWGSCVRRGKAAALQRIRKLCFTRTNLDAF